MKIQIEYMSALLVIRILGKAYTHHRSYLLLDNRKWFDRNLCKSEINRFGKYNRKRYYRK